MRETTLHPLEGGVIYGYVRMFGHNYPTITQRVELTGYHNTKF